MTQALQRESYLAVVENSTTGDTIPHFEKPVDPGIVAVLRGAQDRIKVLYESGKPASNVEEVLNTLLSAEVHELIKVYILNNPDPNIARAEGNKFSEAVKMLAKGKTRAHDPLWEAERTTAIERLTHYTFEIIAKLQGQNIRATDEMIQSLVLLVQTKNDALHEFSERFTTLERDLEESRVRIRELEGQLEQVRLEKATLEAREPEVHVQTVTDTAEIERLNKRERELLDQIEAIKSSKDSWKERAAQMNIARREQRNRANVAELRVEGLEQQVVTEQNRANTAESTVLKLGSELDSERGEKARERFRANQEEQARKEAQATLEITRSELEVARSSIEELNKRIEELRSNLSSAQSSASEDTARQINELTQARDALQTRFDVLDADYKQLQIDYDREKDARKLVAAGIEKRVKGLNASIQHFQGLWENTKAQLENANREKAIAQNEKIRAIRRAETAEGEKIRLQRLVQDAGEAEEILLSEMERLQQENEALNSRIALLSQNTDISSREDLRKLQVEKEALGKTITSLKNRIDHLDGLLNIVKAQREEAREEVQQLNELVSILRREVKENERLRARVGLLEGELESVRSQLSQMTMAESIIVPQKIFVADSGQSDEIARLTAKETELLSELNDVKSERDRLLSGNEALRKEVDQKNVEVFLLGKAMEEYREFSSQGADFCKLVLLGLERPGVQDAVRELGSILTEGVTINEISNVLGRLGRALGIGEFFGTLTMAFYETHRNKESAIRFIKEQLQNLFAGLSIRDEADLEAAELTERLEIFQEEVEALRIENERAHGDAEAAKSEAAQIKNQSEAAVNAANERAENAEKAYKELALGVLDQLEEMEDTLIECRGLLEGLGVNLDDCPTLMSLSSKSLEQENKAIQDVINAIGNEEASQETFETIEIPLIHSNDVGRMNAFVVDIDGEEVIAEIPLEAPKVIGGEGGVTVEETPRVHIPNAPSVEAITSIGVVKDESESPDQLNNLFESISLQDAITIPNYFSQFIADHSDVFSGKTDQSKEKEEILRMMLKKIRKEMDRGHFTVSDKRKIYQGIILTIRDQYNWDQIPQISESANDFYYEVIFSKLISSSKLNLAENFIADPNIEPSMEDILLSIRRILSEDDR